MPRFIVIWGTIFMLAGGTSVWAQVGGAGSGGTAAGVGSSIGTTGQPGDTTTPGNMSFGGIQQTPWFQNAQVQQQLGLNAQQLNQLNQNYSQRFGTYQQQLNALRRQNLAEEQRLARQQELDIRFRNDFDQSINSTLTNPQLRSRFNQLQLQSQGLGAFSDPTIQQRLNLSAEQQQRLNRIEQDWNRQMALLNQEFRTNPAQVTQQFDRLSLEQQRQLFSTLNSQQLAEWNAMIGDPFQFPADVYFQTQGAAVQSSP